MVYFLYFAGLKLLYPFIIWRLGLLSYYFLFVLFTDFQKMSNSSEVLEVKNENSDRHTRQYSEYARLVMPNDTRTVDVNVLRPLQKSKYKSLTWWMKVFFGSLIGMLLSLIFLKWGVPFAFEKVWTSLHCWTIFLLDSSRC